MSEVHGRVGLGRGPGGVPDDFPLKCVRCGAVGLHAVAGTLGCAGCGAGFPIVRGVPRFVSHEFYSESFGFQWKRFARTQLDSANGTTESRDTFVEKTGWRLDELRGKRVLDAGCGMGRFAEACADAGAEVHSVDLSAAVDAAFENLGHRPNVWVYQADIMGLPFPEETFDHIYSIGVLHHTPSTKAAFLRLVPLLKPRGSVAVCVYARRLRLLVGGTVLRALTPRMPSGWLLRASRVAIPLYYVHRVPLAGRLTRSLLPTSMHPRSEWRWLDTFDWYSPRYQWKHSYAEVEGWFREAGLIEIRRGAFPVSVRGRKPG